MDADHSVWAGSIRKFSDSCLFPLLRILSCLDLFGWFPSKNVLFDLIVVQFASWRLSCIPEDRHTWTKIWIPWPQTQRLMARTCQRFARPCTKLLIGITNHHFQQSRVLSFVAIGFFVGLYYTSNLSAGLNILPIVSFLDVRHPYYLRPGSLVENINGARHEKRDSRLIVLRYAQYPCYSIGVPFIVGRCLRTWNTVM